MSSSSQTVKEELGFLERLLIRLGLAEKPEGLEEDLRSDTVVEQVVSPMDRDVVDQALDNLLDKRQEEIARERIEKEDIESINADEIEVKLEIGNPSELAAEATQKLAEIQDDLLRELDRIVALQENSVSGSEVDTMLYVIERDAGLRGNYTIIGGGESLIWNLGNKNNWSDDEIEFVIETHRVAAERNGLSRHLLLDTAILIPNEYPPESAD